MQLAKPGLNKLKPKDQPSHWGGEWPFLASFPCPVSNIILPLGLAKSLPCKDAALSAYNFFRGVRV
jgi:hypothetical protein